MISDPDPNLNQPHTLSMAIIQSSLLQVLANDHLKKVVWCKSTGSPNQVRQQTGAAQPENFLQSLFVGCLTSQQQASVSQGRICSDNFTCCHTDTEVADPTFCLIQSQYTDTGLTSPSADPMTSGAWHGIHWSANF